MKAESSAKAVPPVPPPATTLTLTALLPLSAAFTKLVPSEN